MAQTQITRKPDYSSATREQLILRIRQLEGTIARLRGIAVEHEWLEKIIANPTLSGNEKCAIYGTHKAAGKREPRGDGLTLVYRKDITANGGIGEQTASDALIGLAKRDLMGRKSENVRDEDGQSKGALFVNIEKFYAEPSVEAEKKRGKKGETWGGGGRVKRSVCCNAPVKPLEMYTCTSCGSSLKPSQVVEVDEAMLANEAALQEELKEIEAQKAAAAAGYPHEHKQMLDAMGTFAPTYACFECKTVNWLPALEGDQWGYKCGTCRPHLLASQGRDLSAREEIA